MDLFSQPPINGGKQSSFDSSRIETPSPGITLIKGLADSARCIELITDITQIAEFRHMLTPMGHPTQVAMSNCGEYGWTSQASGYAYLKYDPLNQQAWPPIPDYFLQLSQQAIQLSNLPSFTPDSCLINRYDIGMAMGRHQDKDEHDLSEPIVSISLGLSAIFQVFRDGRNGEKLDILLDDGDVLIMHGPARHYYHGIKPIKAHKLQPSLTQRFNLTLRRAV
jgi:alkylated DNA repair protein (DNA oxidative demethylase)